MPKNNKFNTTNKLVSPGATVKMPAISDKLAPALSNIEKLCQLPIAKLPSIAQPIDISEIKKLFERLPNEQRPGADRLIERFCEQVGQLYKLVPVIQNNLDTWQQIKSEVEEELAKQQEKLQQEKAELSSREQELEQNIREKERIADEKIRQAHTEHSMRSFSENATLSEQKNIHQASIEQFKKDRTALDRQKNELVEQSRQLLEREVDADNGFTLKNQRAFDDLEIKIKSRLEQIRAQEEQNQSTKDELDHKKQVLEKQQGILSRQKNAQDEMEKEIRIEIQIEFEQEIECLERDRDTAIARLERCRADMSDIRRQLDEQIVFVDRLSGWSLEDWLANYESLKQENQRYCQRINELIDQGDLQDRQTLQTLYDETRSQNINLQREIGELTQQLHRQQMNASQLHVANQARKAAEAQRNLLGTELDSLQQRVDQLAERAQKNDPFRELRKMDQRHELQQLINRQPIKSLNMFVKELQHQLAFAEDNVRLVYPLRDLRLFVAGLAMSQLHILQGISGTGKTSLIKAFAKVVGGECVDISVQAGWHGREDLLGYFNAFENRFYEKPCLQSLYRAQTPFYEDGINIILLDEMNLSVVEQYFAEFLSALEKNDPKERTINLSETTIDNPPNHLIKDNGIAIQFPRNVWFMGTANHDETTKNFADKTHDRAFELTLHSHRESDQFKPQRMNSPKISYKSLVTQFNDAQQKHAPSMDVLIEKIHKSKLSKVLANSFGHSWGSRFERQLRAFIPVYVETGGQIEEALDHLLAHRVFRKGKVTGNYSVTRAQLDEVDDALDTLWLELNFNHAYQSKRLLDEQRQKESNS